MNHAGIYDAPIGRIILAADDVGLTHLLFEGDKYLAAQNDLETNPAVIALTKSWLDVYFAGRIPDFTPPLHMTGSPFKISVLEALQKIPYGTTTTYGALAKTLQTSARAVGNAVAHNSISIIIPCHRVIGARGNLTGYSGGLDKKTYLLELERRRLDVG